MSTDTTTPRVDWLGAGEYAARVSETAGPFPALVPPTADDEAEALRAGLSLASLQHGSQRAEIDDLKTQLAIAEDKVRRLTARGFLEYGRGLEDGANLITSASLRGGSDVTAFALREADELRAKAREAKAAAIIVDSHTTNDAEGGTNA